MCNTHIVIILSLVNVFQQRYEKFTSAFSDYLEEETNGLVTLSLLETFSSEDQLIHSIKLLKSSDIKIVVAFVGERDAARVMCEASQAGLTTSEYVWILPSVPNPEWWKAPLYDDTQFNKSRLHDCKNDELKLALESTLSIVPSKYPPISQAALVRVYHTE